MTAIMSDKKCPIDVVLDTNGCWRVLYSDGSLGPALSIDEMLDALPLLEDHPASGS